MGDESDYLWDRHMGEQGYEDAGRALDEALERNAKRQKKNLPGPVAHYNRAPDVIADFDHDDPDLWFEG